MGFKPGENTRDRISQLQEVSFVKDQFIEDVFNTDYVLVIGNEVIMDKAVEPTGDVNRYILRAINASLRKEYKDFNELAADAASGVDPVRNLLNSEEDFSFDLRDMAPELRSLLETRLFPIVLTTTVDGYLETLMRSVWGDRLRVVNIDDKKAMDAWRNALLTYRGDARYQEPTLFYLFGKAEKNEARKYVRTDDDAIQIIEKWILMPKDDPIVSLVRNRKLLALGCKYDDWYFRFFWYTLRREISQFEGGQVAFMLDRNDRSDENLDRFLNRVRIFRHPDARAFMSEITELLSSQDLSLCRLVVSNRNKGGVFLSYCSKDFPIAAQLFFQLRRKGYNVWFDNRSMHGGDDYDREIERAILSSEVVLTVLTPHVAADLSAGETDHYYNKEWKIARQLGSARIIPLAVNGYDFRKAYHTGIYEEMMGTLSGVNLMEKEGFPHLLEELDHVLR